MTPRRIHKPLPRPSIADVLVELGADKDDIPTGFGWTRLRCPFHEDRTPSAAVNHDIDGFVCHSCGRSGDSLKLLQTELRLTFAETVERASALSSAPLAGKPERKRRPSDLLRRG